MTVDCRHIRERLESRLFVRGLRDTRNWDSLFSCSCTFSWAWCSLGINKPDVGFNTMFAAEEGLCRRCQVWVFPSSLDRGLSPKDINTSFCTKDLGKKSNWTLSFLRLFHPRCFFSSDSCLTAVTVYTALPLILLLLIFYSLFSIFNYLYLLSVFFFHYLYLSCTGVVLLES